MQSLPDIGDLPPDSVQGAVMDAVTAQDGTIPGPPKIFRSTPTPPPRRFRAPAARHGTIGFRARCGPQPTYGCRPPRTPRKRLGCACST